MRTGMPWSLDVVVDRLDAGYGGFAAAARMLRALSAETADVIVVAVSEGECGR